MEGRKLQLAGGSTYLVSLPKRWVQTSGLKAGDTLFVQTELDGSVSGHPGAHGAGGLSGVLRATHPSHGLVVE
jgi:phosphate uptake regulator